MDDITRQMFGLPSAPREEPTPPTMEDLQRQIADLQKENEALKRQLPQKSTFDQEVDALRQSMARTRGRLF